MASKRPAFLQKLRLARRWLPLTLPLWGLLFSVLLHLLPPAIAAPHLPTPHSDSSGVSTWISAEPPPHQSPSTLLQQGKTLYQSEQFHDAAIVLEQAVQTSQPTPLYQALALSYLALTYQQLGQLESAKTAIERSLALLLAAPEQPSDDRSESQTQIRAQVLNTQGRLQLAWGQVEAALTSWQLAMADYESIEDTAGVIGSQLNQVQALRALGLYRRAQQQIEALQTTLDQQPDRQFNASRWRSLGEILGAVGDLDDAKRALITSLNLAQEYQSAQSIAASLLSLGNLERAEGDRLRHRQDLGGKQPQSPWLSCPSQVKDETALTHYQQAAEYYQESAKQAQVMATQIEANLNLVSLQINLGQWPSQLPQLQTQLDQLAPSRTAIYARVNFAKSLGCLHQAQQAQPAQEVTPLQEAIDPAMPLQVLQTALHQAEALADIRAQSYAMGHLGGLYASLGQIEWAKRTTTEALRLAQQIVADDIAYQWQWQLGRLWAQTGKRGLALSYYQGAFQQLQGLRSDLVALNTDIQFSFRESIEPLYRQYVDLLLRQPRQSDLRRARQVIEALQLAELDNFFRDACSNATPELIDRITDEQDLASAIVYPILLDDRLEVILKLPQQPDLRHYSTPIPATQIRPILRELRQQLEEPYTGQTLKPLAAQVYDWLIRPAEEALAQSQIKTLTFVLDGPLRNIPMAVLYDGQHYLVEIYAVALTPGLQLLDPQPLRQIQVNALTGGLAEGRQGFTPLPNVVQELETIQTIVPTEVALLDQTFNEANIEQGIRSTPVSIVHLATHGRFSSQTEETFILTYDARVNINELETLLRTRSEDRSEKIELLVLSACETASGDERAALGLAGVAVRAGARSTLASLWQVNDKSTADLLSQFYQQLYRQDTPITKAAALRQAQLAILKDPQTQHPLHWAAFVLLGNWL